MTAESRVTMARGTAAAVGAALVLAGAAASYLATRRPVEQRDVPPANAAASPSTAASSQPASAETTVAEPLPDVVVPLTKDAVERAGITVSPVSTGEAGGEIRLPGIVEPNAYREVVVTPLVSGRITRVLAELGARVRRGQTVAQIYSPDLAEAQTKYVAARAMLEAHDRELQRTQKLVDIGAASRQELERIHAEHAAQTAAVQSARSQLELLGVPASTVDALGSGSQVKATTSVPAPIDGVVTERAANVGLNVDPATALFKVVDLSTVWISADVYEKDFSRVRIGSKATVTTAAYPGQAVEGRVSYMDPQVNPETRTAKIRVEIPNPRAELRLGMYTDVLIAGSGGGASRTLVPRSAVQNVGDRTVVYLSNPDDPGKFTEREVSLGRTSGEQVEVRQGLQPGHVVVTEGSFFVRAERERLGLRSGAHMATNAATAKASAADAGAAATLQSAKIVVSEQGFEPAKVTLRAGSRVRLTFVRTTEKTCATEVVFPSLKVRRPLPLNQPVDIEFTPDRTGEMTFACGMNMLKGTVVVQ